MSHAFDLARFESRRAELEGNIRVTPLLPADSLSRTTGCSVYLKAESLQITHWRDRQRHRPHRAWLRHRLHHAHWGGAYFPAFNIADSAITIGAGLLILDAFREQGSREKE